MPGRLPDPPPTPWGKQCTMRLPNGQRCMAPRVALATPPAPPRGIVTALIPPEAPRIVLACLHCDFGEGRAECGPPRFMAHMRGGGV